ncbi:hypothetical protein [Bacillus chungangensis]|uniref:Uncharacterized protein n=1 Tax=Bacillus chungangensis TaxID=587633 RepID=A0ABT9WSQ3_9BACI|nr:hypothetical protein [Bacillus chungangensis]MDQ0176240.1 hypothetical protein [Bacillus chungangensis]
MKVGFIYHTEDYHKLIERMAWEYYQSYPKREEQFHTFIRDTIEMSPNSVTSVGNIVLGVTAFTGLEEYSGVMTDLMTFKEINNFIRWTFPDAKKNPDSKIGLIVSMNMSTFIDIDKNIKDYDVNTALWKSIKRLVHRVPELRWISVEMGNTDLKFKENSDTAIEEPELYSPIILSEDYTVLKERGLTNYELDVHATITMNLKIDRTTVIQMYRQVGMVGGSELPQPYVEKGCIFPNAIITKLINCRPLRQWKHFLNLSITKDAQKEIQLNINSIKKVFNKAGIQYWEEKVNNKHP